MNFQEIVDHIPPQKDLVRMARFVASLRRPARAELMFYGIAGLLIGAGVALLLAPSRGSELRGAIGERFEEYWRATSESVKANGHAAADER